MNTLLVLSLCLIYSVSAQQRCSGNPPTFNGMPCATTTRYSDGTMGACGCGSYNSPAPWENTLYTAAASQEIFDEGGESWCGSGCGQCFRLTPTGGYIPGQGYYPSSSASIVVMVTNLCPNQGNEQWCAAVGGVNQYGYPVHFDLRDAVSQIENLGWNNPEVTYQQVSCSNGDSNTPTCADWSQCQCSPNLPNNCAAGGDGGGSTGGSDGNSGVPSSFQWANGVNGWWVAFGLQTSAATMDCGQGPVGLPNAGWTISGEPVWVWQGYPYQCAQTVTINWDGGSFSATRPG